MEPAFTEQDRIVLLRFAAEVFPAHIGASVVMALARSGTIDDAAITADADRLQQLGWQPAIHDPELVASLVIGRRLPMTPIIVGGLREIAEGAKGPAERGLAERAAGKLREMTQRVLLAADGMLARRSVEPCRPAALEALYPAAGDRERFLRDACVWIVSAIGQAAHESWDAPAIDAALRLLERQMAAGPMYPEAWSVNSGAHVGRQRLDASVSELLSCASLECVLQFLERNRSLGIEVRQAALGRARELSQGARAEAGRFLRGWLAALPPRGQAHHARGALGIFSSGFRFHEPSVSGFSDEVAWLRAAGSDEIVAAGLQLVCRGYPYALVQRLVEPEHRDVFERAVIERFESGTSTSSDLERIADCLFELGTEPTADALLRGLAGGPAAARASERVLSRADARTLERLLVASVGGDPKVALRATRALAARADKAARAHFEALALGGGGAQRWVAIVALGRLARHSGTCEVLRRACAVSTAHEQRLILETLPHCAAAPEDLAWTLELPVRPGLEGALSHCVAWLVALSSYDPADHPHEWFERLLELLRERPDRIETWTLGTATMTTIVDELRRRFPGEARLAMTLAELVPSSGGVWMHSPAPEADDELVELYAQAPEESDDELYAPGTSRGPAPQSRPRLDEAACFSVLAPECVAPSESFLVEVFVHSKAARDALARWSSLPDARRFTVGPRRVATGATLDVTLSIDGIELAQPSGQVLWDGDLGILLFPCTMPVDALSPTYPGRATFSLDGLTVAETHFLLTLGPVVGARREIATRQRVIRSAFASYATVDRPGVLARIQGMQKVVPFIDIFLDVVSLRAGERWAEVIRTEIQARDVLLLFWSTAASQSHHVESEWRFALEAHGLEGISPVPLESPAVAPPPPELASLHFNDWTLSVRRG